MPHTFYLFFIPLKTYYRLREPDIVKGMIALQAMAELYYDLFSCKGFTITGNNLPCKPGTTFIKLLVKPLVEKLLRYILDIQSVVGMKFFVDKSIDVAGNIDLP